MIISLFPAAGLLLLLLVAARVRQRSVIELAPTELVVGEQRLVRSKRASCRRGDVRTVVLTSMMIAENHPLGIWVVHAELADGTSLALLEETGYERVGESLSEVVASWAGCARASRQLGQPPITRGPGPSPPREESAAPQ